MLRFLVPSTTSYFSPLTFLSFPPKSRSPLIERRGKRVGVNKSDAASFAMVMKVLVMERGIVGLYLLVA